MDIHIDEMKPDVSYSYHSENSGKTDLPRCSYDQKLQEKFSAIIHNKESNIKLAENKNINANSSNPNKVQNNIENDPHHSKSEEMTKLMGKSAISNKESNVLHSPANELSKENTTLFSQETSSNDLSSIFSNILNSAQNTQLINPNTIDSSNVSAANAQVNDTQKIIDQLVDKILVSDPQNSQGSEVIIKLGSNSVIVGTEIVLQRSLDGTLSVIINAKNSNQFKKIIESKDLLEKALEVHEKGMFKITINDASSQKDNVPSSEFG